MMLDCIVYFSTLFIERNTYLDTNSSLCWQRLYIYIVNGFWSPTSTYYESKVVGTGVLKDLDSWIT
jgi:hypothetical protein